MSFHPNDVARRGRIASLALVGGFVLLTGAFFRTQVLQNTEYKLQSEQNRFREIPLPAPRGIIYDRNNQIIAENLPGYSVSILSPTADSLRASLRRLGGTIPIFFHFVLATFILVVGLHHFRRLEAAATFD